MSLSLSLTESESDRNRRQKVKVPMHMHSARDAHVHYAPYHEMACTIEIHSLNSISAPNLVSIAQNFPEPEDPSRINISGLGARGLYLT